MLAKKNGRSFFCELLRDNSNSISGGKSLTQIYFYFIFLSWFSQSYRQRGPIIMPYWIMTFISEIYSKSNSLSLFKNINTDIKVRSTTSENRNSLDILCISIKLYK